MTAPPERDRYTPQAAVTVVAPVLTGAKAALRELLEELGADPAHNAILPLGRLDTLHFARFVVLEAALALDGSDLPASLVFLSDIDGPPEAYLRELVRNSLSGIDRIYGHCEDYPAAGGAAAALAYLRTHLATPAAMYVNTVGRSVNQVRREAHLHDALQGRLDALAPLLRGATPTKARTAIRRAVAADSALAWARYPVPKPSLVTRARELLGLTRVVLTVLVVAPLMFLALPFLAVVLRLRERSDPAPDVWPDLTRVRELAAREDLGVQNQFTAVGFVKPGRFRLWTAIAVLWLVNAGVRIAFSRGSLAGVTTIHFARWVLIDDNRRLLFASNYDGSLESYMDDFIDRLAWGLNAVFSNGVGYPRTSWLIGGGARAEGAFKRFIRTHQVPTQVWYSAYDRLTAVNIANNAAVRAGLSGAMNEAASRRWLRRL